MWQYKGALLELEFKWRNVLSYVLVFMSPFIEHYRVCQWLQIVLKRGNRAAKIMIICTIMLRPRATISANCYHCFASIIMIRDSLFFSGIHAARFYVVWCIFFFFLWKKLGHVLLERGLLLKQIYVSYLSIESYGVQIIHYFWPRKSFEPVAPLFVLCVASLARKEEREHPATLLRVINESIFCYLDCPHFPKAFW